MKAVLMLLTGLLLVGPSRFQDIRLTLDAVDVIVVGDEWTLDVRAPLSEAGEQVSVSLLSGLQRHEQLLTLGSGGVARWEVPPYTLTATGRALVIARLGDLTVTRSLTIFPDSIARIDSLTTANTLQAYGDSQAMIVAMAQDTYGNLISDVEGVQLTASFPDGTERMRRFRNTNGLLWRWLPSQGTPGRVRLRILAGSARSTLELRQIAGQPHVIQLAIDPPCLSTSDERDLVSLNATVRDEAGEPVAEGTRVQFRWASGVGSAIAVDGEARLRLPAPPTGSYEFVAAAGGAQSMPVTLTVDPDAC